MTVGFLKRLLGPLIIGLAVVLSLLYFINAGSENLKNPAVISGWFLFGFLILLGAPGGAFGAPGGVF